MRPRSKRPADIYLLVGDGSPYRLLTLRQTCCAAWSGSSGRLRGQGNGRSDMVATHLTRRGHARVPLKGQTRPTPGAQRHGFPVSVSQCGSGVTARRNTTRTPGDFGPRLETGTREAVFIDTQELIRLWKGPQRVFLVVRRPRGQASWRRYRKPGSLSSGATARAGSSRIARLTAVTIRTPPSRLAHSSVRTVFRKLVMWAAWITVSPGTKDGFGHAASV